MTHVVKPILLDLIPTMTTKRLLAYLKKLHACEQSPEASDIGTLVKDPSAPGEVVYRATPEDIEREVDPTTIRFKNDPRWVELYNAIKAELATREHVPTKE